MAFEDEILGKRTEFKNQASDRPRIVTSEDENNPQKPTISAEDLIGMAPDQLVELEIASMINARKEISRQFRDQRRTQWDKCWDHYLQRYDRTNKKSWQSVTFQPETVKAVETILSNLQGSMMGPEMPVEFQTKITDIDQNVRAINEIMRDDMDKSKFKVSWADFLRSLCIQGTAIGKVEYVREEKEVIVKEKRPTSLLDTMMRQLGIDVNQSIDVRKNFKTKDWASFKNVDLYKIYPEPGSCDFSTKHWVIEEDEITNRELIEGMRNPDPFYRLNVPQDVFLSSSRNPQNDDPDTQSRRVALMQNDFPVHLLDPDVKHRRDQYWGPVPRWFIDTELKDDDRFKYEVVNAWIWLIDGQFVVFKNLNPYRDAAPPYVKGDYIRVPNSFYGLGPAEIMIGLQIQANEVWNTRMDNVNLALNKIIAVLKDNVSDPSRLISEPGGIWQFDGIDDIRKAMTFVEMPDMGKDTYLATESIQNQIQEATGAVKATLASGGSEQGSAGTFRGQLLNKQVATERFMLYARMLEVTGLSEAFRKMYERVYQFKDPKDVMELLGPKRFQTFQFILPEVLETQTSIAPLGVLAHQNKGVRLAQMEVFTKLWAGEPWFKKVEMARKMWIEMENPDPDAVIFSDEELNQYNQIRQMAMASGANLTGQATLGLVGPDGSPINRPRSSLRQNSGPVAGNSPSPTGGLPRPAQPAAGPGSSPIDLTGRPLS